VLHEIELRGGQARRSDKTIYCNIADLLGLTEEERQSKLPSGANMLESRTHFAMDQLVKKGETAKPAPGVWMITPEGKDRLEKEWPNWQPEPGVGVEGKAPSVNSAEEATEVALSFLSKHYRFIPQQPTKAVREKNLWLVEIDVGLLRTRIAKIKVDAEAATILEYDIPPEVV
jgi:hypothetical protein